MKLSFIIPYFNEPVNMLGECIESILALGIPDNEREIIVIDDGSNHSPSDFLHSINSDIICLRQDNKGPGAARNRGIDVSTGDYIQFVDSDDRLLPDYRQCINILSADNPDVIYFHGRKIRSYRINSSGPDYMLKHNLRGAACCLTFRKAILGNLRYDSHLINEDELFNAQLILRANTVTDVGVYAYFYRQRPDSRSHATDITKATKRLDDALTIIQRLNDLANSMSGTSQAAMQRRTAQLTMDYIYNVATTLHSPTLLRQRLQVLRRLHLIPLPLKPYTLKYYIFAVITKFL